MISRGESRQYLKYTLSAARLKLLYERITLTRFSSLYFFTGLLACIVLSSLQIASLVHDSEGVNNLSSVIAEYNRVAGLALLKGDTVELCSGLPDQTGTLCNVVINFKDSKKELSVRDDLFDSDSDDSDFGDDSDGNSEFSDDDSEFSDDDSDDEDDIVESEETTSIASSSTATSSPATSSTATRSTSVTIVLSTSTADSISSVEEVATSITTSSTVSIASSTILSSSSIVVPTLTVVTTASSSSTTASSSILSSVISTQGSSTTAFTFSSTLLPSATSTGPVTLTASAARSEQASSTAVPSGPTATTSLVTSKDGSSELGADCIVSLMWVNDVIHDTQREDVVILVFQLWLFVLAFVTVLNESIPHLGTGLFGDVLGTAWAGYRVYSTHGLMDRYRNHIVPDACNGRDFMGDWWENRIDDAIALVVLQAVTLVLVSYLSLKLFNVYASQTYKRAGASSQVHAIYKLVLLFSVCLQLSGFMSIASGAMWIDKVSQDPLSGLARHAKLYLAAFVVTLVIQIPWVFIGWICVRRESRIKFSIFCLMSAFSFAISFAMFYSDLYRFLVSTWPFFATMTITAFILVVVTTILGVLCRLKFGRGLAEHLKHTEEQDDDSFAPVYIVNPGNLDEIEKFGPKYQPRELPTVAIPRDGKHFVEFPIPVHASRPDSTNYADPEKVPTLVLSSNSMEPAIVPVTRMSVFSKALKRFSMRALSPSVKSLRPDPWMVNGSGDLPSESIVSPLPSAMFDSSLTVPTRHPGQASYQEMEDVAPPRTLVPPSPMETLSAYSFVTPRQTITGEEMAINIRSGGQASIQRQSSGSAYSYSSRKVGLPANPKQSTSSAFSLRSGTVGASVNPRGSIASNFSFTTRSVGYSEHPRQSFASDTFSVKSRLVGLPANPRSRVVSTSQSNRA